MNKTKLEKMSDKILAVLEIITTVRDACIATEKYNYETVLNLAIERQEDVYEEFESLY